MSLDPITAVLDLANTVGSKLVDRLFPDKVAQATDRAKAELALATLQSDAELRSFQTQLSAILAEAQSTDPWTSRARPSFMYVMYVMILMSIPMGVIAAFKPELAKAVATGMQYWLAAVPDSLWALFGAGYLGYSASKSFEKKKDADVKIARATGV